MKTFIPLLVLAMPLWAQANCNKKVDPSKVMLFIDTNKSELEIETSLRAACERGERLVIVPKNYKDYTQYTSALESSKKKFESCASKKGEANCQTENKNYEASYTKLAEFTESQPTIEEGVADALDEIKSAKAKVQVFTISGHDGGGSFGGNKGGFGRQELADIMKEYQDVNDVKSVLLLGCYTGVQKEIFAWKNIFPEAKLIAGYDGSAPLADRPQGHQYITDMLLKEKQLLKNADEKKLKDFTRNNIKSLNQLNAAMYLNCEDDKEFYYASAGTGKNFKSFDTKECIEKKTEIEALAVEISKYESGELEPPKDTQGALRQLYNKARRFEHCSEIAGVHMNVNNLFNLLFYHGVKESFASFYKDDLKEAQKIIAEIDVGLMQKTFEEGQAYFQDAIDKAQAQIDQMEKDPEAYLAKKKEEAEAIISKRDQLLNNPAYAQVKNLVDASGNYIGRLANPTEEEARKINELMAATYAANMAKYSYEAEKNNLPATIQNQKLAKTYLEQEKQKQTVSFNRIKEKISGKQDLVWSPNAENLSKKSRKETLQNMHDIHGLLSISALPDRQRKALKWLSQVQEQHLVHFQNPFSWHEFTGRVEEPQFASRLQNYLNGNTGGFGYTSGYTTPIPGAGYGGGIVGGSLGGGFSDLGGFGLGGMAQ